MSIASVTILFSILLMSLITFGLRLAPFLLFQSSSKTPPMIQYLGRVMPSAIIAMLIVYCIRNVHFTQFPSGLSEIIGIASVICLHIWKRQFLFSILGGTVIYMAILHFVVL